jgi:hypothetical protein
MSTGGSSPTPYLPTALPAGGQVACSPGSSRASSTASLSVSPALRTGVLHRHAVQHLGDRTVHRSAHLHLLRPPSRSPGLDAGQKDSGLDRDGPGGTKPTLKQSAIRNAFTLYADRAADRRPARGDRDPGDRGDHQR